MGSPLVELWDATRAYTDAAPENGRFRYGFLLSQRPSEDAAAANLIAIRNTIAKEPKGRPPKSLIVVLGRSAAAYTRPYGVHVVPISALRP